MEEGQNFMALRTILWHCTVKGCVAPTFQVGKTMSLLVFL